MRAAIIWPTLGIYSYNVAFSSKLRAKVANFPEERFAPSSKKTYFVLIFVQ